MLIAIAVIAVVAIAAVAAFMLLNNNGGNKEDNTMIPKTRKLNNGLEIPMIGLGSSRISNIVDVVYGSIKDGLRLIDTAFKYGNEDEIGEGLKKALDDGLCKREDLFILVNYG